MLDVKGYQKERKEIIHFIKENQRQILKDEKAPGRDKIAIRLLNLGYPLYRIAWKLRK